ncbi:uncharacterized protein A4U43_C08F3000 [Asparagus officinalis]|uniref:trihelix transcription factor ASIL2-like n=1 Tax=Asparagus officinalis TaxID=4686 RepID=UPI00098DF182|nr:trihelix transcription factor ASIL2-like [Asparagus officinalis]XP_020244890.1 trihelix transcription factor ASIL2-like [Asparagus officinalis]XP_020244891.1 trihelix transcription factor ASIL2-like [Asparagus officinalis]XP_020244892.1 trihelix transcription factor ASIL2-like [Asparagus officinalis]XP_020244893.1 trihelix transcription factor ASIL2-like [Asparagus officinalis]ONK59103.1 uncharacterized protein A4U43_C08F3000 [Asparagus officinalis]
MDGVEDDARYAHKRHHQTQPQFSRNFTDQEGDDEYESNSDGIKSDNEGEGAIGVDEDDGDYNSSMESRGKRRKLDNFEFVPRKPAPLPVVANSRSSGVKNSPPDWSEDSTFVLLEAWGDLFVSNGRKSLRFDEWSEVAKKVNQDSRITRSDSQCRNRLDTLKKKYKKEKARMAEIPNFKSDWIYFKKMDSFMSSPSPAPVQATRSSPLRLKCGVDAGEYVFSNSRVYLNRANAMDEMRDSPGDTGTGDEEGGDDDDGDDSDGLPPTMSEKRRRGGSGSFPSLSFKMLSDSIQKFSEVYEKIESNKRQQMVELERMRMEFHRDLEVQKRQILERGQAEIARIRQEEGEDEEEEEEEERMVGEGDGDEDEEMNGSAENLSS